MITLYLGVLLLATMLIWLKVYIFGILFIISMVEIWVEKNREIQLPRIPRKNIMFYIICYLLLGTLLYLVMYLTKEVPGSDIAHKMIFG